MKTLDDRNQVFTERDVIALLAREGAAALDRRIEEIMTSPVASISTEAFLYRAVARMRGLGVRRLLAVDAAIVPGEEAARAVLTNEVAALGRRLGGVRRGEEG